MKTFNLIVLVGIIVFTSCSKEDDVSHGKKYPVPIIQENFNFYKSAELYSDAQRMRSESYSDVFEIEKVERVGNRLDVTVSYKGNCEINKFDVIWDGIIMESWPVQTRIMIKRSTSNCDSDGEIKKEILSIDLVELIGDTVLVEGAIFHVSNASKTPDEANADTIITN